VQGGETITVGGRSFELIWTPGHTEGHVCVFERATNTIFTGDHMLARITPHIGMWRNNGDSPLHRYEESLALIEQLAPARALAATTHASYQHVYDSYYGAGGSMYGDST